MRTLPPRRRGDGGWTRLLVAAAALLVVLATLLALLAERVGERNARDDARQAATQVARQEAVNLTTLDYRHASRDLERILALATGGLRQRFAAERSQFPSVLGRERSRSNGAVLSAGLARLSDDRRTAQVVVAADAVVTTGVGGGGQALKHYRMVLKLRYVGGRWLVSDLAFAGVPE